VAVVGESGSGKSTLARVVMGLLPPTDGEIIHDGTLLPKSGAKRSRGLQRHPQMIHQMADTALNPKQWIKDIVSRPLEFFLGMKGAAKEARIKELLTLIKLDPGELMNRLPSELSRVKSNAFVSHVHWRQSLISSFATKSHQPWISWLPRAPFDDGNLNRSFTGVAFAGPTQDIAGFVATHLIAEADLAIDIHSGGKISDFLDTAYFCWSNDPAQNAQTR
jgi:adenylate kinase family enzyme